MHVDMLLLAERLVVAMERMSHDVSSISLHMKSMGQDVKNLSSYVYDLNCTVTHYLSEQCNKVILSPVPCKGSVNSSSGPCEAEHEASAVSECPWQNEETDGSSLLPLDNPEHENISLGEAAPTSVDHDRNLRGLSSSSHPHDSLQASNYIKSEAQTENEGGDLSYSDHTVTNTSHDQLNISPREINRRPHLECSEASYNLKVASSSSFQPPPVEGIGMNVQEFLSNKYSCEGETDLQNLPSQQLFSVASCSTPDETVNQHGAADRYISARQREGSVAGKIQRQFAGQVGSDRGANSEVTHFEREILKSGPSWESEKKNRRSIFHCSICKRQCRSKAHFDVHMRMHRGERPFKCSQCQKAFFQKGDLVRHMRIHMDKRPYKCTLCKKAFRERQHLNVHFRTHTGEKPFKCSHCGKCFSQGSNLATHKLTHKT